MATVSFEELLEVGEKSYSTESTAVDSAFGEQFNG